MNDRLEDIKARREWVRVGVVLEDFDWMVAEVEQLRRTVDRNAWRENQESVLNLRGKQYAVHPDVVAVFAVVREYIHE